MAEVADDFCLSGAVVNGDGNSRNFSVWPPGFRFHPTDEELVLYYLKRKICKKKLNFGIIREIDVYKWDPEELPGQSGLKTGDRQWFFFSPRDRKYPNGARSNRATRQGYWKATGKDRSIACNSRNVGVKKTLVFYRGKAPSGARTDWVMHEYTMDEDELNRCHNVQDYYALYKVFKKSGPGPKNGEQYGAPFKEEEWVDGDFAETNDSPSVDSTVNDRSRITLNDTTKIVAPVEEPVDDLYDLLQQFVDDPDSCLEPLGRSECDRSKTAKEMADSTLTEVALPEVNTEERSFSFGQTVSTAAMFDWEPGVTFNDDGDSQLKLEDFLEIDDLLEPQPVLSNMENIDSSFPCDAGTNNANVHNESNFLVDDDLLFDPELVSLLDGIDNPMNRSFPIEGQTTVLNNLFLPESSVSDQTSMQLHNQATGFLSSAEANDGLRFSYAQGVSNNIIGSPTSSYQNPVLHVGSGNSNSGFASSIWAFLESIPSTPASASESILMSKPFDRMTSFSWRRLNSDTKDDCPADVRRKVGLSRHILMLSVIGALCAILWIVLNGLVMRSGRSIFS